MIKRTTLVVAAALVPMLAAAQESMHQGYLVDSYGNGITTSSNTELCWHSSDWTPARSVEPCDPVARKAQVPAAQTIASVAAQPEKVAAAPAPAPAARVAPQSVRFSADELFAYDKAALKPEGKAALDEFAKQLSGAQYDAISVTGHTDRLGRSEYNQKLSERRAHTVKDYLVSKDVPAQRITTDGKGETQPVTQAGDCKGAKSAKVIACLQPDRRVQALVTGTRAVTASAR